MSLSIKTHRSFQYIEEGSGHPLLLLHGLFGALSNWQDVLRAFSADYRVLIPLIPIYSGQPVLKSVGEIAGYVQDFIREMDLEAPSLVGNSLGGHVGLMLCLREPESFRTLTLTGSSGLFEAGMGMGYPQRGNYQFIKERVEFTFYNAATASDELIEEMYETVNDRQKAIRIIQVARDAQQMNLRHELAQIHLPVCLIWGLNDNITPPHVAHEFHYLLPWTELNFVDHCGHAPMMEQPTRFNRILEDFLARHVRPHALAG